MAEITVSYQGGLRCEATHAGSGMTMIMDGPKDYFGRGESFSPSDLLSVSLGGCILSVVGIAAERLGVAIEGTTAIISKEMGSAPRRIVRMAVTVNVSGELDQDQKRTLEEAAHSCPVHQALGIEVPIYFHWLI